MDKVDTGRPGHFFARSRQTVVVIDYNHERSPRAPELPMTSEPCRVIEHTLQIAGDVASLPAAPDELDLDECGRRSHGEPAKRVDSGDEVAQVVQEDVGVLMLSVSVDVPVLDGRWG